MARKTVFVLSTAIWIALLAVVWWVIDATFALHLLTHEVTRELYEYRTLSRRDGEVNLIPEIFSIGDQKVLVEERLIGAGLDAWDNSYVTVPAGTESVEVFRMWGGTRHFVCGSELFIELGYDSDERLQSATIQQGGACL